MSVPCVSFYRIYADAKEPFYATAGSACFDLHAYIKGSASLVKINGVESLQSQGFVPLEQNDIAEISTGIVFDIPAGYSIRLHPRSGLSLAGFTLANCEGIIDSDYVEEVKVLIKYSGKVPSIISHGQRICQAELVKVEQNEFKELWEKPKRKTNRIGGFGSTGKD